MNENSTLCQLSLPAVLKQNDAHFAVSLLYVYICSLNAKSKDSKPCQPGRGEGRRTLPKLSSTLCAKTIHMFLFLIILLSASVGLNLLTYHGE